MRQHVLFVLLFLGTTCYARPNAKRQATLDEVSDSAIPFNEDGESSTPEVSAAGYQTSSDGFLDGQDESNNVYEDISFSGSSGISGDEDKRPANKFLIGSFSEEETYDYSPTGEWVLDDGFFDGTMDGSGEPSGEFYDFSTSGSSGTGGDDFSGWMFNQIFGWWWGV